MLRFIYTPGFENFVSTTNQRQFFLTNNCSFQAALAPERVRATDPRDGPWLRSVAIEPLRSISGEFDGNVMVDIARTHPSLTDPDITS